MITLCAVDGAALFRGTERPAVQAQDLHARAAHLYDARAESILRARTRNNR